MRRKLVTYGKFSLSGTITKDREEWVTESCNVPLFDDESRKLGECKSCRSGWTHEHNYKV